MPYEVKEVTETHLTLTAQDGSCRTLTLESAAKYLKRPYCMTGHATQGLSLGARIYVHDWNPPVDSNGDESLRDTRYHSCERFRGSTMQAD